MSGFFKPSILNSVVWFLPTLVLAMMIRADPADEATKPVAPRTFTFQPRETLLKAREKAVADLERADASVVTAQQTLYAANREGKPELVQLAKDLIEQNKAAAADCKNKLLEIDRQLRVVDEKQEKCKDLELQLKRERDTLQRQQQAIRSRQRDLQLWTDENEQAKRRALVSGGEFILEHAGWELESRCAAADNFGAWFVSKEWELKERGVPYLNLKAKIDEARTSYTNALIHSRTSPLVRTGVTAEELWSQLRTYCTSIAYEQTLADASLRGVLDNTALSRFLKIDPVGAKAAESSAKLFGKSKELPKITSTSLDFESFTAQFGYKADEWAARRSKIPAQTGAPTATELESIKALKSRIEISMQKLADCYAKVSQ